MRSWTYIQGKQLRIKQKLWEMCVNSHTRAFKFIVAHMEAHWGHKWSGNTLQYVVFGDVLIGFSPVWSRKHAWLCDGWATVPSVLQSRIQSVSPRARSNGSRHQNSTHGIPATFQSTRALFQQCKWARAAPSWLNWSWLFFYISSELLYFHFSANQENINLHCLSHLLSI